MVEFIRNSFEWIAVGISISAALLSTIFASRQLLKARKSDSNSENMFLELKKKSIPSEELTTETHSTDSEEKYCKNNTDGLLTDLIDSRVSDEWEGDSADSDASNKKREELKRKLLEGKKNPISAAGGGIFIPEGKLAGEATATNYEVKHLSNYYSQVLYQSKISFWFSLIFASLGFVIIILSFFIYGAESIDKSILSFISGIIIEAVSALFFVQSNKARKTMGNFFEKLRRDKNNSEAKSICNQIEDSCLRDITKIQLVFKLAEIVPTSDFNEKMSSRISWINNVQTTSK